jgi:hypothetical protein
VQLIKVCFCSTFIKYRLDCPIAIPDAVVAAGHQFNTLREASLQLVVRIVAWSLAATIVILSLVPSELRPETGVPHLFEHFLIFAVTGAAFGLGYEARRGLLAIQP